MPDRRRTRTPKWDALQYQPAPGTDRRTCGCGAVWLDDEQGRAAHYSVFGHVPAIDWRPGREREDRSRHAT